MLSISVCFVLLTTEAKKRKVQNFQHSHTTTAMCWNENNFHKKFRHRKNSSQKTSEILPANHSLLKSWIIHTKNELTEKTSRFRFLLVESECEITELSKTYSLKFWEFVLKLYVKLKPFNLFNNSFKNRSGKVFFPSQIYANHLYILTSVS